VPGIASEQIYDCLMQFAVLGHPGIDRLEVVRGAAEAQAALEAAPTLTDDDLDLARAIGILFSWRAIRGGEGAAEDRRRADKSFSTLARRRAELLPESSRGAANTAGEAEPGDLRLKDEVLRFLYDGMVVAADTNHPSYGFLLGQTTSLLRTLLAPEVEELVRLSLESAYISTPVGRSLVADATRSMRKEVHERRRQGESSLSEAANLANLLRLQYAADPDLRYLSEAAELVTELDFSELSLDDPRKVGAEFCCARVLDWLGRETGSLVHLDSALQMFKGLMQRYLPGDIWRLWCAAKMGRMLAERFQRSREIEDLSAAVDVLQITVDEGTSGGRGQATYQNDLAHALRMWREHSGDTSKLDYEITLLRRAHQSAEQAGLSQTAIRADLYNALLVQVDGDFSATLDEIIDLGREVLSETAEDDPNRLVRMTNLSLLLTQRYMSGSQERDLVDAEELAGVAEAHMDQDDAQRYIVELSVVTIKILRHLRDPEDQAPRLEAAQRLRSVLPRVPVDYTKMFLPLTLLAGAALGGTVVVDDAETLTGLIAIAEAWCEKPKAAHLAFPAMSGLLMARFMVDNQVADLDGAYEAGRHALTLDWNPGAYLSTVNGVLKILRRRFEVRRQAADLDAAVDICRAAMDRADLTEVDRWNAEHQLAFQIDFRYENLGDPADVDEAVEVFRQLTRSAVPSARERVASLLNLARALYRLPDRSLTALNEAMGSAREALTTYEGEEYRIDAYDALGILHRARFQATGDAQDLEQARGYGFRALRLSDKSADIFPYILTNLSGTMLAHFVHTGEKNSLDEAVQFGRDAVRLSLDEDDPELPKRLSNLAAALRARYDHTRWDADLTEAIELHRRAVGTTPEKDPSRVISQSNLAGALITRAQDEGTRDDLVEALETATVALDAIDAQHPSWPNLIGILTRILSDTSSPATADLPRAMAVADDAWRRLPDGHTTKPIILDVLARVYEKVFAVTGEAERLQAALDTYGAVASASSLTLHQRVRAYHSLARLAARAERWDVSADAFLEAANLLPLIGWSGLTRQAQQIILTSWPQMVSEALVCCARAGRPVEALQVAELTRGVLLGQSRVLRDELSAVRRQAPHLFDRLTGIRTLLDEVQSGTEEVPAVDVVELSQRSSRRSDLAQQWQETLSEVRELPGMETYLTAPAEQDLIATARDGPVITIAASEYGATALIVTSRGVHPVDLPNLR
jgi:hypothetical protein